jgi:outer membrane protein
MNFRFSASKKSLAAVFGVLLPAWLAAAQQKLPDTPEPVQLVSQAGSSPSIPPPAQVPPLSGQVGPQASGAVTRLSLTDAENIALKQNPTIFVARLIALASQQVTREVRSNLWPTAYANVTAVDAHDDSRIAAGGLNNPVIYERAAVGTTVSQLISDFGHTTNLVASARLHARAEDQNALATKEEILLAVNQAFYGALQAEAVLRVAQQTVDARQLTADQVGALTKSKLKSGLDLSFANVNLSQAKLLFLDAQNRQQASFADLSALLGYPDLQNVELVEATSELTAPPASAEPLIAEAFSKRPEILALEFESESANKFRNAQRDELFPTISALGAVGNTPVGDGRLSSWYGAVGVNVQVPVFNGFLFTARTHEADLRAQASTQQLADLRNRISRDVRNSWLNASTAYQRVAVNQELLTQANQALDLAQTRYKLGLGSIVELSQAQLQQTEAEIAGAQASYQYRLALSVLQFQTSGL